MPALQSTAGLSSAMTLGFALAGGIAVGNLYWAQPLLAEIGADLCLGHGRAGLLITLTQLGYAIGILLLVPLGDVLERRYLIPLAMLGASLALAGCALAPGAAALCVALVALGLLTTGGQMLPPLASDLALPAQRGRAVGTIASGMLSGILLSRVVSGLVAEAAGWRAVFALAALATAGMALLMWRVIPAQPREGASRARFSYPELLGSMRQLIRTSPVVRATLLLGAACFGVFSMFWTGLTFLLSQPPYGYTLGQIGLIGIAGLAGALAARNAGKLHDRGLGVMAQGIALGVAALTLCLAGLFGSSILAILAAIVLFDAAIQTINVLNQLRLLSALPEARSRLNALFVTANFLGGAAGSALAGIAWPRAGWPGLMLLGGVVLLAGLGHWYRCRQRFAV